MWVGPSAGGSGDNWPDTGRSARTRAAHTNTYDLTTDGQPVAVFYTKVHDRLLRDYLPLTGHLHQPSYATAWPPSTDTSTPTPTTPASERQPENSRHIHEFGDAKLWLRRFRDSPGGGGPFGSVLVTGAGRLAVCRWLMNSRNVTVIC